MKDYKDIYVTGTRQTMRYVHKESECKGQPCPIHNPTDHPLKDAPTHWRTDRGIMERICEHGIGHPDPDDIRVRTDWTESRHGCDGCCCVLGFTEDENGIKGVVAAMPCERCGNDPCICHVVNKPGDMVNITYGFMTYKEAWNKLKTAISGVEQLYGEDSIPIEYLRAYMETLESECE